MMVRIFLLVTLITWAFPALASSGTPGSSKATFTDAPPPPPPPPAKQETPRNDKPMEDATKYYKRKEFTVEGANRHTLTYFWRQPATIESAKTYPLVLILHDVKGLARAGELLLTSKEIMDANPSFIVVPALPLGKIWAYPEKIPEDPPQLQKFSKYTQALPDVMSMVESLMNEFPIDDKRIYVVGCGDGGWGAFGAAAQYPRVFAAAIPISGGWTQLDAPKLAKTPIYALHGEDDKITAPGFSRNVAYLVQKYKGAVWHLSIKGLGHDCNDPRLYQTALWKWMYSMRRK